MSCNCEGKTINIGMGCCQPVLGPVENYYTKWETERYVSGYTYSKEEIDEKTSGETSGCCITPEEVDEKIASAKTEIENEIPSLSGYATEEYVSSYTYDKQTIDEKVAQGGTFDPTQYYNKTATDALLAEKVSQSDFQTYSGTVASELSGKASQGSVDTLNQEVQTVSAQVQTISSGSVTSAEVRTMIDQSISGKTNESDFTAHTSNNDIHVTSTDKTNWNAKPNVVMCTEAEWQNISGSTINGTIYLVY